MAPPPLQPRASAESRPAVAAEHAQVAGSEDRAPWRLIAAVAAAACFAALLARRRALPVRPAEPEPAAAQAAPDRAPLRVVS